MAFKYILKIPFKKISSGLNKTFLEENKAFFKKWWVIIFCPSWTSLSHNLIWNHWIILFLSYRFNSVSCWHEKIILWNIMNRSDFKQIPFCKSVVLLCFCIVDIQWDQSEHSLWLYTNPLPAHENKLEFVHISIVYVFMHNNH